MILALKKWPSTNSNYVRRHKVIQRGEVVNDVAYVGFFKVEEGGVIVIGDRVYIGEKLKEK